MLGGCGYLEFRLRRKYSSFPREHAIWADLEGDLLAVLQALVGVIFLRHAGANRQPARQLQLDPKQSQEKSVPKHRMVTVESGRRKSAPHRDETQCGASPSAGRGGKLQFADARHAAAHLRFQDVHHADEAGHELIGRLLIDFARRADLLQDGRGRK